MNKPRNFSLFLLALSLAAGPGLLLSPRSARATYAPKVAVVLCRASYDVPDFKSSAHMSSQALVGLANLVGAPYDTVMLDELLARPVGSYSSVWFSTCGVLAEASLPPLGQFLGAHLAQGGTVLLDGPLGAYAPPAAGATGAELRGSDAIAAILNVEALGSAAVQNWVVRTAAGGHPLQSQAGWAPGVAITQGLADGTELVGIANPAQAGAHVLLELANGSESRPYLVATRPGGGRVLAVSGYGNDAGAASPFRNDAPRGFFDNLLLPRLVDAALWLLSPDEPSVGLQLSHAPMTAVVRLDADQSDTPAATRAALDYLIRLGRDTGVTTAYAVVSSFAQAANWEGFDRAPEIEQLGGALGSHSHTHASPMSQVLGNGDWDLQIGQSMSIVRDHFAAGPNPPRSKFFINPGSEIDWSDYRRFFRDTPVFFTHGHETSVPYASGVSAFDLPAGTAPVALFADTQVPDYQWLYDPNWTYSVAQATAYQKQILGYYQNRVGRGVLYNQMWHDYAINNDPPLHDPTDLPTRPLYDVVREHFAQQRIYAPGLYEAGTKLQVAQRARFSASSSAGVVTTKLDLSALSSDERLQLAGMGLRLNGVTQPIVAVTIDGGDHPAFTADTVILPRASAATMVIVARTGAATSVASPRLTYLSKAFAGLTPAPGTLAVQLATPGLFTRFCLALPAQHVVLGADHYAAQAAETCGALAYGSSAPGLEARALTAPHGLSVPAADRRILALTVAGPLVTLDLAAGGGEDQITFRAAEMPLAITAGVPAVALAVGKGKDEGSFVVTLPGAAATSISLRFGASVTPETGAGDAGTVPAEGTPSGTAPAGAADGGVPGSAPPPAAAGDPGVAPNADAGAPGTTDHSQEIVVADAGAAAVGPPGDPQAGGPIPARDQNAPAPAGARSSGGCAMGGALPPGPGGTAGAALALLGLRLVRRRRRGTQGVGLTLAEAVVSRWQRETQKLARPARR